MMWQDSVMTMVSVTMSLLSLRPGRLRGKQVPRVDKLVDLVVDYVTGKNLSDAVVFQEQSDEVNNNLDDDAVGIANEVDETFEFLLLTDSCETTDIVSANYDPVDAEVNNSPWNRYMPFEGESFQNQLHLLSKFFELQIDSILTPLRESADESEEEGGHVPTKSGGRSEELVCQLLEDAINTEASLASPPASTKTKVAPQFDIYGFPYISHQEEYVWDEVELEARATVFLRKHDELSNQAKDAEKEISVQVKWENHLVSLGSRPLQRGVELKNLIRAGVPVKYRNKVWKACVEWRVCRLKSCYSYNYYEGTLALAKKVLGSSLNPIERQIEVDLLRTLPENKHYQCLSSDGIPQLRRVLLAYAVHNPEIGYCQGLNRITAIALLFLGEEDSFWCLVAIVESLLSTDHYSRTLLASHVDQRVLKDLVADKLPRLAAHFDFHKVDMSLFTFNWFMTIFIDNIPVETFLRIWDAFLYEGGKVLFRYALAFLKHQEENLLKCDNDLKLHGALRELGSKMTDINTIAQVAFQGINPFPMKHIQSRRQFHTQIIKVEMEKFETMRSALELTSSMPDSMAPDTVEYGLSDEETS